MNPRKPPTGLPAGDDPIAKATEEVEAVIAFVRKAMPPIKRTITSLTELAEAFKGAPSVDTHEERALHLVQSPCAVCGGRGVVGMQGHEVMCPPCQGKGFAP